MRKTITLPSGGTVTVRGLKASDFIIHGNEIPTLGNEPSKREPSTKQVQDGVRAMKVALLSCCSPITFEGVRRRIVEKELDVCTDAEISIEELSDDDAVTIWNTAIELSGLGKEAGALPATFPKEEVSPSAGQDSNTIPLPSVATG